RFARHAFDRECASAAERSDLSPLHSAEQFLVDCAGRSRLRRRSGRFCGPWCLTAFFRRWSNRKSGQTNENERRRKQKTQSGRKHPFKVESLPRRSTGIALKCVTNNRTQLKNRLIVRARKLRERCERRPPFALVDTEIWATRNYRTLRVRPFGKCNLVQDFSPDRNAASHFITTAERLLKLRLAFSQLFALPHRFQCRVVCENDGSEISLNDHLRFRSKDSVAALNLFIKRQADRCLFRIVGLIDEFERSVREGEAVTLFRPDVTPVGQINAGLQSVYHSEFNFVAEIDF